MEYLRWDDAKRWPASDCAAYDRFALREGDVVLAMDRPWVKAGLKRAQISGEDLPAVFAGPTNSTLAAPADSARGLFVLPDW